MGIVPKESSNSKWVRITSFKSRRLKIANLLNLLLLLIMILITAINYFKYNNDLTSMGNLRLWLIGLVALINVFLLKRNLIILFKLSLIFIPVFVLFIMPSLFGHVYNDYYFYYPLSIITLSMIPALILNYRSERTLLIISIIYYFILLYLSDHLLNWFSPEKLAIVYYLEEFYLYYKLVPVINFIIVQLAIFSIRRLNMKHEEELVLSHSRIEQQNKELQERNDEIEAQSDALHNQKEVINRQKKDLTDSINYAKHIQTAVLPADHIMKYLFPEHFILNRPRDIVSGDFYWVGKNSDNINVVLADCTGHGVAGAFMSILGISLLNEVFNNHSDLPTNRFMDELREHVMLALNQTGRNDDIKMGMDMSLLKINRKTGELHFTGAYHSLYIFRGDELVEIKGDRISVSVSTEHKRSFTAHKMKFEAGDTLYLTSDGYPDQFGQHIEKKYGYPRFRQLITDIHNLPIQEQLVKMTREMDEWQGNTEQVDDILVLGIRI